MTRLLRAGSLIAMVVLPVLSLSGQSAVESTPAGVAAFSRGDFARAAAILQPIAERFPASDDHTAQWFMAQLYEAGLGVPKDSFRACVLFHRAIFGDWTAPEAAARIEAARDAYFSLDPTLRDRCQMLSNLGLHHNFEDATIELDAGHWVRLEIDQATIGYQGRETRTGLYAQPPGSLFLPVEHTELTTGGPEPARRHFIELFVWEPNAARDTWTLQWHIAEVVRADWVQLGSSPLLTVRASEPPRAIDVRALARLQLERGGGVEAIVLAGANPARTHIDSDTERREDAARETARRAADQRVDWQIVRDIRRTPSLAYGAADGCERLFVYGWSADRAEAISVRADQELLQLSTAPRTFDLAVQRVGLDVNVHVFERAIRDWPFCTDVQLPPPGLPVERWHAIGGVVTIAVTPSTARRDLMLSDATIQLTGATFVRDDGVRVVQTAPIELTGTVGWFAG
jgi:hypothetical protein